MEFEHHLPQEWKSIPAITTESEKISACFDCSICLDSARDPVVTLCGHLYCWPCIYKWLKFQSDSLSSDECAPCPVCKAEISNASIVPLYGRGKTLSGDEPHEKSASPNEIPPRPNVSARHLQMSSSHHDGGQLPNHNSRGSYQNFLHPETINGEGLLPGLPNLGSTTANAVCHPVVGMFGEMVYARVFGNSESLYAYPNSYYTAGSRNARLRRQEIVANKSLSRVSFFLFCCVLLCLILF